MEAAGVEAEAMALLTFTDSGQNVSSAGQMLPKCRHILGLPQMPFEIPIHMPDNLCQVADTFPHQNGPKESRRSVSRFRSRHAVSGSAYLHLELEPGSSTHLRAAQTAVEISKLDCI